jgi:hypothetical protein
MSDPLATTPYAWGHAAGVVVREDEGYDPRWAFDASLTKPEFREFLRGFAAGFNNQPREEQQHG